MLKHYMEATKQSEVLAYPSVIIIMPQVESSTLQPLQEHYLLKEWFALQLSEEFDAFADNTSIQNLYEPQSHQSANTSSEKYASASVPLLSYCFRRFVLPFPFTARTKPEDRFWDKVDEFLQEMNRRKVIFQ